MSTPGEGTPDWLQPSDVEAGGNGGAFTTDLEAVDPAADTSSQKNKKERSSKSDGDDVGQSSRPPLRSCRSITLLLVSTIFLGLFVFSAIVQNNDLQGIQWIVFYSVHAAIAAAFIVHWTCCFPEKLFYLLTVAMTVWSIVYVVMGSIQLSKTEKGGPDTENDRTEFEDVAFELAGACIGLASTFWHGFMTRFCVKVAK
jgi:hypothetical protein